MKPIQAVFISDLHLHPQMNDITTRFEQFITWAKQETEAVYILGDFLHVWPGDDALNHWSQGIAAQVRQLSEAGVKCFFMVGNRDFLLGPEYAELAQWNVLPDPFVLELAGQRVLLSHGDRYCTEDKTHQWFRWITRRPTFIWAFTRLPLKWRKNWAQRIRSFSKHRHLQNQAKMIDVSEHAVNSTFQEFNTTILVHGHTHRPKIHKQPEGCTRFVLSDWDDKPQILCYYKSYGFKFVEITSNIIDLV